MQIKHIPHNISTPDDIGPPQKDNTCFHITTTQEQPREHDKDLKVST